MMVYMMVLMMTKIQMKYEDGEQNNSIDFNKIPVIFCEDKEVQTKKAKILIDLLGELKLIYQLDAAKIDYKKNNRLTINTSI